MFKKFSTAAVATAVIATASISTTTQAQAKGPGPGFGIAAGLIGGIVIGTAIASQPRERVYVTDDEPVVCRKVRVEDEDGNRYWKRVCN